MIGDPSESKVMSLYVVVQGSMFNVFRSLI